MNSCTSISNRIWNRQRVYLWSSILTQNVNVHILIPKKIKRKSTDVLQAILDVTPPDRTTYPYKYIDDPMWRPTFLNHKWNYPLAKESGMRVAEWIHTTHNDLFQKPEACPKIPAFSIFDISKLTEKVSEDLLLQRILKGDKTNSLKIYELLGPPNVSMKTKLALFEMLCYCNKEQLESEDYRHVEYFSQVENCRKIEFKTDAIMKLLFSELIVQDPDIKFAAYNALLAGMAKYRAQDGAVIDLFRKCCEEQIPLNINCYNELLLNFENYSSDIHQKRAYFQEIVYSMIHADVEPNVRTLNACLSTINLLFDRIGGYNAVKIVLNYFNQFHIKPSLATYMHMIDSLSPGMDELDSDRVSEARNASQLSSILDEVASHRFEVQDFSEVYFFPIVMRVINEVNCKSTRCKLALKLHDIFNSNDNRRFLAKSILESRYCDGLIAATLPMLPIADFFKLYRQLYPYEYFPSGVLLSDILKRLSKSASHYWPKYLPDLIRQYNVHINSFVPSDAFDLCQFTLLCAKSVPAGDMRETLAELLVEFFTVLHNGALNLFDTHLGFSILLNISHVLILGDKQNAALVVLKKMPMLQKDQKVVEAEVKSFLDLCISQKLYQHITVVAECLLVCCQNEAAKLMESIYEQIPDVPETKQLRRLVAI